MIRLSLNLLRVLLPVCIGVGLAASAPAYARNNLSNPAAAANVLEAPYSLDTEELEIATPNTSGALSPGGNPSLPSGCANGGAAGIWAKEQNGFSFGPELTASQAVAWEALPETSVPIIPVVEQPQVGVERLIVAEIIPASGQKLTAGKPNCIAQGFGVGAAALGATGLGAGQAVGLSGLAGLGVLGVGAGTAASGTSAAITSGSTPSQPPRSAPAPAMVTGIALTGVGTLWRKLKQKRSKGC